MLVCCDKRGNFVDNLFAKLQLHQQLTAEKKATGDCEQKSRQHWIYVRSHLCDEKMFEISFHCCWCWCCCHCYRFGVILVPFFSFMPHLDIAWQKSVDYHGMFGNRKMWIASIIRIHLWYKKNSGWILQEQRMYSFRSTNSFAHFVSLFLSSFCHIYLECQLMNVTFG